MHVQETDKNKHPQIWTQTIVVIDNCQISLFLLQKGLAASEVHKQAALVVHRGQQKQTKFMQLQYLYCCTVTTLRHLAETCNSVGECRRQTAAQTRCRLKLTRVQYSTPQLHGVSKYFPPPAWPQKQHDPPTSSAGSVL